MSSHSEIFDYQHARREGDAVVRRGLVNMAKRLLEDEGPHAMTLRRLAKRANCSTKVVYTLFGGKSGLSEALYVEGFALLRLAVERERRRHRDAAQALVPVMLSYRSFALENRVLFGVMFGTSLPDYMPSEFAKQQAGLTLEALETAVAEAYAALDVRTADTHETAIRLWGAVHGPVCLELEGIAPFHSDGERLARLAVTDTLAGLGLARTLNQASDPTAGSPS